MAISKSGKARFVPNFRAAMVGVWSVLCAATPVLADSSHEAALPQGVRTMTALEIYRLYKDRSWRWDNGAGRMADTNRHFTGWINDVNGMSWAVGRWVVPETGKMCLYATWHTQSGSARAESCFAHRIADGAIYQKRLPDGAWYVFRHAEVRPDDEARKLIPEDLVTQKLDVIKADFDLANSRKQ